MQNITKALLALLNKGIVNFTYRKVDGSIRTAVGTRNLCFACQALGISIPLPKTGRENPTAYYDIEKEGWRSFKAENVLSINGVDLDKIKGIKDDRIVPVGSMEEVDIPINVGGGFGTFGNGFGVGGGFGIGGGVPKEEIHKAIEQLDKDIEIPIVKGRAGMGVPIGESVAVPFGDGEGMVFTPLAVGKEHTTLPIGGMSIEDFAKLVAKYVVAELADRLMR
jgi:hypothetical protein